MRFLFLLIFFITYQTALANMDFYISGALPLDIKENPTEHCHGTTSKQEVEAIIKDLISDYYPDLEDDYQNGRIQLREFKNKQYFLKAFFKLGHVLRDERVYFVDINPHLYSCAPPKDAFIAILAHELKHISDYKELKPFGLIKLGLKMLNKKTRSKYERSTDLHVLELGLANGIKEYRHWVYSQLSDKGLKKKKCFYYTPEEINRFIQGERDFSDYFNKYCKN